MFKKITAAAICLVFLFGMIPDISSHAAEQNVLTVRVLCNGEEKDRIEVGPDKNEVLEAEVPSGTDQIRWQILTDEEKDLWADIESENEKQLEVTYLMAAQAETEKVFIRCAVSGGGTEVHSAEIQVIPVSGIQGADNAVPDKKPADIRSLLDAGKDTVHKKKAAEPEYVFLTINYLDENGKEVFSPYKAKIQYGTDFVHDVPIPTFIGFSPFINDADTSSQDAASALSPVTRISVNETGMKADKVINVFYKPADVPYGARYFFQNIQDDGYTERPDRFYTGKAKTGTVITDSELAGHAGDTAGFTALYHYPETVAADGSTVFESYYDRNYYLIKFDMDGGFGTQPVYARYESPLVVSSPSRPGYEFTGWDLAETDTDGDGVPDKGDGKAEASLPRTVPDHDLYYKALWKKSSTKVIFVYWRENPDDSGYSYWSSKVVRNVEPGITVSGKDDIHIPDSANGYIPDSSSIVDERRFYQYDADRTEKNVEVKGDGSTLVNVYYKRNVYTLKFYYASTSTASGGNAWLASDTKSFSKSSKTDIAGLIRGTTGGLQDNWKDVDHKARITDSSGITDQGSTVIDGYYYHWFSVTGKYGSRLDSKWPLDILSPVKYSRLWNTYESYFGAWTPEGQTAYALDHPDNQTVKGKYAYLDKALLMKDPAKEKKEIYFLAFWTNLPGHGSRTVKWVYRICVPPLEGKDIPADKMIKVKGKDYELLSEFATFDLNENFAEQTPPPIAGFTYDSKSSEAGKISGTSPEGFNQHYAAFAYKRNNYSLRFYNYNQELTEKAASVPYNSYMSRYDAGTAPYPSGLEKGAYEFGGWYTSQECVAGTEYDFAKEQMPAKDLILYAKWTPKKHTVNFFRTYEGMKNFENGSSSSVYHTAEAGHGKILGEVKAPDPITEQGVEYKFSGWFYMDNGRKVSYIPQDIPVMKDLNVFAEWGSMTAQPYQIDYRLKDGSGTEIAPARKGFAYQGTTRTFTPKSGLELNEGYRQGYFPTSASHSITMQHEDDKEHPASNVHSFEYVYAKDVRYTIRYIDKTTGKKLRDDVVRTTSNGVVTERFEAVRDYVPDAFYKRLVLSVVEDGKGGYEGSPDNVITFMYTPSEKTAFYAVHHMMQKPGTDGTDMKTDGTGHYIRAGNTAEGVADLGRIDVIADEFTGFTAVNDAVQSIPDESGRAVETPVTGSGGRYSITVDRKGTELYIFYKRNLYPYTVEYREWGTEKKIAEDRSVSDVQFGSTVTEHHIPVSGYAPIDNTDKKLVVSARPEQNRIVFYYTTLKYTVGYRIKGGGGTLSTASETIEGSGTFSGAVPEAGPGYAFEGWYTDRECTNPVTSVNGSVDPDTFRFVPEINANLKPSPETNIFYASFRKLTGDITIHRTGADPEQTFVYSIKGPEGTVEVAARGNDSITVRGLMTGEYTVTADNGWSWRYASGRDTAIPVKLDPDRTAEVTFSDSEDVQNWLNGYSAPAVNQQKRKVRYLGNE